MPDWLSELTRQFPVLAVVLLVVWYAVYYIREQHKEHMTRVEAAYQQHLKSKDDAMKALSQAFKEERKHLAATIADLRRERDRLAGQPPKAPDGGN